MNQQFDLPLDPPFSAELEFGQQLPGNPDFYAQFGYPAHNGLDLSSPQPGAPVKAAGDSTGVRKVGFDPAGYGNYVVLDHPGGIQTYYAHLDQVYVRPGKGIPKGSIIGTMGATGSATGPHVHFGVKAPGGDPRYKGFVNPRLYLAGQQSIILPAIQPQQFNAIPLALLWRLRSEYDMLNIRSGPGTNFADVGDLLPGQTIESQGLYGGEIWIKLADGSGWAAALHQGHWYLEAVQ